MGILSSVCLRRPSQSKLKSSLATYPTPGKEHQMTEHHCTVAYHLLMIPIITTALPKCTLTQHSRTSGVHRPSLRLFHHLPQPQRTDARSVPFHMASRGHQYGSSAISQHPASSAWKNCGNHDENRQDWTPAAESAESLSWMK